MASRKKLAGFTLMEVMVAIAVFTLFALGVFEGSRFLYKIVYLSRLRILETAILSEELEVARNLPYESVGISGGVPVGILPATKSITRNGTVFNIATTIRNIDDTFDGTLGGDPNDTSPADYKLVEMSIICAACTHQSQPVVLSTRVAPKQLEGASENGALYIQVFDATGQALQGANVHVVNSSTNPFTIVDDTTDNNGMLRIIDAPTGTQSYAITVSKADYSSDYTTTSNPGNPYPIKMPVTVSSQTVTDISFAIDRLGTMNFYTVNPSCAAVGSAGWRMRGEKIIGTDPYVYKFDRDFTSDGSGSYNLGATEWDKYHLTANGTTYSLYGTIPISPLDFTPGMNQEVYLVLTSYSSYSLWVKVIDASTKLPLSDATVRLYKTGYDTSLTTGLGYLRQTDWSSGSGQVTFTDEKKYFSDDGNLNVTSPAGDMKLKKPGSRYVASGWLESSTFDFGEDVNYSNLVWKSYLPSQVGANAVKFQIATSNSSTPASWDFVGPDGTAGSYFTPTSTVVNATQDNQRYLRYRAFLSTANTSYSPTLYELSITYTNNCVPPGQVFFPSLSATEYNLVVSRSGYITNTSTLTIEAAAPAAEFTAEMSVSP